MATGAALRSGLGIGTHKLLCSGHPIVRSAGKAVGALVGQAALGAGANAGLPRITGQFGARHASILAMGRGALGPTWSGVAGSGVRPPTWTLPLGSAPGVPPRAAGSPGSVVTGHAGGLGSVTAKRHAASPFIPRRRRHRKAQKGRLPQTLGGSTRGTRVVWGDYGLRVLDAARMTARQLDAVRNIIRRVLKPVKGARIYMRVFPDLPVTSKGAETRMGKGKGNVEFWACRVRAGRVIFEIGAPGGAAKSGGIDLSDDLARQAITAAMVALPVRGAFVRKVDQPPVNVAQTVDPQPEATISVEAADASSTTTPAAASSSSAPKRAGPTTPPNYYAKRLPAFVRKYKVAVPPTVRRKMGIDLSLSDEEVRRKYTGTVEARKLTHIGQL